MNPIGLEHYLLLSSLLFILGIGGLFLNRKTVITVLISLELLLLAVNINFVAFSHFIQDITGQIFTVFILTVAAAEAAIGLAILVIYYRNAGNIDIDSINQMKG